MSAAPPLDARRELRVVLAPSAYYPHVGGIEELTRQLAHALAARGHAPTVVTNRWPSGTTRRERLDGVDVERLRFPLPAATPANAARFLATAVPAAALFTRTLRRLDADVVHVIGAGPQASYVAAVRDVARVAVVFTAQGELTFDATNIFGRSWSLRAGLRAIVRRADVVTACSAFVLRDVERFAAPTRPGIVVPNGVDVGEFAGAAPGGERGYVLAVGRLVPQKGFDTLVDAAAELPGVRVIIAGEGPERGRLEEQARLRGVADRVRLPGSVTREQLASLLAGAAAFAFPSRGEGFGIALLEAMAAGVPAVAAAAGGIQEFADDGSNALVVPPDDPSALAAALARVLADANLAATLVENGRTTAARLAWPHIAERFEELYLKALA